MNRIEFMNELESLLADIPADEREEAIRYYQDYFDDAGFFEEDRIIEELGSPAKVAKQIKSNLYGKTSDEAGEYTERGYSNPYFEDKYEVSVNGSKKEKGHKERNSQYGTGTEEDYVNTPVIKKNDSSKTILIIVLAILFAPIWLGLAGGAFGLIFGLAGGLFGIVVGFGAAFLGLSVGGVITIGFGIAKIAVSAPAAMVMIGVGFLLVALGLVFLGVTIIIVSRLIPAIIRGITSLLSRLFNRNKGVTA